jgi:hypothetical protein
MRNRSDRESNPGSELTSIGQRTSSTVPARFTNGTDIERPLYHFFFIPDKIITISSVYGKIGQSSIVPKNDMVFNRQ